MQQDYRDQLKTVMNFIEAAKMQQQNKQVGHALISCCVAAKQLKQVPINNRTGSIIYEFADKIAKIRESIYEMPEYNLFFENVISPAIVFSGKLFQNSFACYTQDQLFQQFVNAWRYNNLVQKLQDYLPLSKLQTIKGFDQQQYKDNFNRLQILEQQLNENKFIYCCDYLQNIRQLQNYNELMVLNEQMIIGNQFTQEQQFILQQIIDQLERGIEVQSRLRPHLIRLFNKDVDSGILYILDYLKEIKDQNVEMVL